MNHIAESARSCLVDAIDTMTPTEFSKSPGVHFTRSRKLSFRQLLLFLVSSAKGSIPEELRRFYASRSAMPGDAPSRSAFIQQRAKLSEQAMPALLQRFNSKFQPRLFRGFQLLACDGSELAFHSGWDWDARVTGPGGYYAVHLVALYDLLSRKYTDAVIQPARLKNEHEAICQLAQRLDGAAKRILTADRGFGSYNFYLHAGKAGVRYLVRITEKKAQGILGEELFRRLDASPDITVTRRLVRHQRKSEYLHPEERDACRFIGPSTQFDFLEPGKAGEVPVTIRIARVKIGEDSYEYLATDLPPAEFSLLELKDLYRLRWGIETSFRDLKHTLGAEKFRSRHREFVIQELWARMILYNFCMEIANQVSLRKRSCKYVYRINIAQALKVCHEFLCSCEELRRGMDVPGWILKAEASPVRDGRKWKRKPRHHGAQRFNYR